MEASEKPSRTLEAEAQGAVPAARSIGYSGMLLSGAKLYFIVLGLGQQVGLSWVLQDAYGALRGALSPASITYNPLVSAGVQGISRAVSRERARENKDAVFTALLGQAGIGALAALGFFLLAPALGAWLHSPHLVGALRILALVVLVYGVYAPVVGVLNGQHRFLAQAGLDVLSATVRTAALIGGAYLCRGGGAMAAVQGACWGFALASMAVMLIALVIARVPLRRIDFGALREHLAFVVPVIGSQVVLNLLLQSDTNLLRRFAARAAVVSGLQMESADTLIAAYAAGQLFGFLPYQLLIGVTFILFPLLSESHARADRETTARLVRGGLRIAALLTGLLVAVCSGLSAPLLRFVFPPQFADHGAQSMTFLCVGLGFFALFGVFSTILNSLGRQWQSLMATLLALGAVLLFNWLSLSGVAFGPELLLRTALATSAGVVAATGVAGYLVWRHTGAALSGSTLLRLALALGVAAAVAHALPTSGRLLTALAAVLVASVYLAALIVSREISGAELSRLWAAVRRRGR